MGFSPFPLLLLGRSLLPTLLFGAALVGASLLGRALILPESSVALVWPAAGVAFLWLLWARSKAARSVTALVLILLIITLLNAVTGAGPLTGLIYGVANAVQAGVAVALFSRWVPQARLHVPTHYLWFLLAAVLGAGLGAGVAAAGVSLTDGGGAQNFLPWLIRNSTGLCLLGAAGLVVRRRWDADPYPRSQARPGELALLSAVTAVLYAVMPFLPAGVPVAFIVLVPAVWISMRFSTPTALVYALLSGAVLVVLTLAGAPPFQAAPALAAQVAQLFLLVFFSITAILALARDERHALITDLQASRQEAEAAAHLRDLVISRMSDGVYVAGPEGELLLQNDAARQLLARDAPDGMTGPVEHHAVRTGQGGAHPEDELPLRRALQGETVFRAPMDISRPNGSVLHLSVDAVPLPLAHGTGAVAVFRNVTDELQYQAQLSRFAAVVAHDLGNPLTVFDGWLELLEERVVDPMQRSALAAMQAASSRMSNLINSLLTYSAAKNGNIAVRPVNLGTLIAEVAALRVNTFTASRTAVPTGAGSGSPNLPDEAKIPDVRIDASCLVLGDERLLEQLFDNLIGNSIKYTPAHTAPSIDVVARRDAATGTVTISVADEGIGIPEEETASVFTEFQRASNGATHARGFGLGLSICQRIVASHKGQITVSNRPTGGCLVTVTLPAAEPARAA